MQNVQIEEVDSHKYLGLHLSQDCTWHKQIDYIKENAWFRIIIMRKLKFKLDRKSLETIYIAFYTCKTLTLFGTIVYNMKKTN